MPSTGPILAAIDFSATADAALQRAVALAKHQDVELVVVYCEAFVDRAPIGDDGAAVAELGELAAALRADERRQLDKREATIKAAGVKGRVVHREGAPGDVIPALVTELGAALVVIGTHGRSGLSRFLLGSVAEVVVRRSPCDVLVTRADTGGAGFRNIMVATDFSPPAEQAMRSALAVAMQGARLRLVHSWQYPVGAWGLNLLGQHSRAASTVRDAITTSAQAKLDRAVAQAKASADLDVAGVLVEGHAASAITDLATHEQADLIAIGTHGYRGVERWFLGSVAEATVRHAPCSVLVSHSPPPREGLE